MRGAACRSLRSCDLQGDGGVRVPALWGHFIRYDWDCAAIRVAPPALPKGSGCWVGPHGTPEAPALADVQGPPRGDAPVRGLTEAPATQRHHRPQAVPSTDACGARCGSHLQDQCGHFFRPQETPSDLQTGLETAAQTHPGAHLQPLASPILEPWELDQGSPCSWHCPAQCLGSARRQGQMDRQRGGEWRKVPMWSGR